MRLLVLLILVAATVAPSAPAAGADTVVLARIDNEAGAMSVELLVQEGEDVIFSRTVDLPANDRTVVEITRTPGIYTVSLLWTDPDPHPVSTVLGAPSGGVGMGVDARDCPGKATVDFRISVQGPEVYDSGCLVLSTPAAELLAQARAAKTGVLRPSFEVPAPGSADRGVFGGTLFEWRGESEFLDVWGRPTVGPELRYVDGGGSGYWTSGGAGAGASAEVDETIEVLRFLRGSQSAHAWSSTVAGSGMDSSATSTSVAIESELRYDEPWGSFACAIRNGMQGRSIRPGDSIESADICAAWDGPAWRATAPITIEEYRLLPLYQLHEDPERLIVGRVLLLDGMPYPMSFERYVLPADRPMRIQAAGSLERYQAGGEPLALEGADASEPRATLAPLDPLRGPADAGIGARLPFTLGQASDAARADASLRGVQDVIARPDAALIGAAYGIARDEGSPFTMHRWALIFSAEGMAPAEVICERPDSPLPVAPPARCALPFGPTALFDPISAPPRIGRDALPARATSFADVAARWDATRGIDGDPISYAVYHGWESDRAAFLAVGAGVASPLTPAGDSASGSADHVALELATARTLAAVQVVQQSASLSDAPLATVGPSTLRASDAPFTDPDALPLVVGSGIGLALLALLGFLLYSRLVRARVLDSATRAAILDVVTAEPGLHSSGIMEALGKRGGVTEYHLDVLVREGFLTSLATPGFRRYFATGSRTPQEMRAIAAMREGQNEKLMRIIRANPGIPLQTLAMEAGVSVPYASRSIARLAEAGLVEKVQVGRAVTLHAAEA